MQITVPEGALWVVAAAIVDEQQQVLLSQRHAQAEYGGFWEFPGGKVEAGESAEQALVRELREELGIRPLHYRPLITVPYPRPQGGRLWLQVFKVTHWSGTPAGLEGQPVQWVPLRDLRDRAFPPANHRIVSALQLPTSLRITAPAAAPEMAIIPCEPVAPGLESGWLLLRQPHWPEALYASWVERCCQQWPDRAILVHDRPDLLGIRGVVGVHCSANCHASLQTRPVPLTCWFGGSAHTLKELRHLEALQADYASLSPVLPTHSHPGQPVLGWQEFAALVAQTALPIYALGGMTPQHQRMAWQHGAQGVAGISGFVGQDPVGAAPADNRLS